MDNFFYIVFIKLYPLAARIISLFNNKALLWYEGRKNIFEKISSAVLSDHSKKIWMHCASLGEFEQGRPLLEKFREIYPHHKLVLTFFSPSGYEVQKETKHADYVFYLPIDSEENAELFFDIINPALVVFVKYEYWYYYLSQAHKRKIPLLLVSGIFLKHFSFFKWYGKMRREMLHFFTRFFVQTEHSKQLLQSIHITNVSVSGDTRFDRVLQVASELKSFPEIENFINNKKTIVAGSTWTDDDEALDHFTNTHQDFRFIIAPHDIGKERLKECCRLYKHSILYSDFMLSKTRNEAPVKNINTLIIDNIGMLKFLYRYATVCYVGGGFGSDGIHNILEAAVYCKPVLFGPAHENFSEAVELIDKGGAFDVEDVLELETQLEELLTDDTLCAEAGKIAGNYVNINAGATNNIIKFIQENLLLTN